MWVRSQPKVCSWDQEACEPLHSVRQKRADYVEKLLGLHLLQSVVYKVINIVPFLFVSVLYLQVLLSVISLKL